MLIYQELQPVLMSGMQRKPGDLILCHQNTNARTQHEWSSAPVPATGPQQLLCYLPLPLPLVIKLAGCHTACIQEKPSMDQQLRARWLLVLMEASLNLIPVPSNVQYL